jgi:hypothetical protein
MTDGEKMATATTHPTLITAMVSQVGRVVFQTAQASTMPTTATGAASRNRMRTTVSEMVAFVQALNSEPTSVFAGGRYGP